MTYNFHWDTTSSQPSLQVNEIPMLSYKYFVIITLVIYDYMLQLEKEVTFVWERQMSVMAYLYLVVRYFGIVLATYVAVVLSIRGGLFYMPEAVSYSILVFMQWGLSGYFCLAEVILIWRLYALYNRSKPIHYVLLGLFLPVVGLYIGVDIFLWSRPSAISVEEIVITPNMKYCSAAFHIGPMPVIYAFIPIICYDIFLVVLAVGILWKHMKERKELKMKPNTYVVMIVRYDVIYFVL
ncbi:hypothetical protein BDR03DRAFT_967990 [Suillus americanus]|nr:hypothetical protein BDR03DRAFT_967990 [Suillus americanus]